MVRVMITSTSGTFCTFQGDRVPRQSGDIHSVAWERAPHSDRCHGRDTVTFLFQFPNHLTAQQQPFFYLEKHQVDFFLLNKQDLC